MAGASFLVWRPRHGCSQDERGSFGGPPAATEMARANRGRHIRRLSRHRRHHFLGELARDDVVLSGHG
jgi:hypothetical protein